MHWNPNRIEQRKGGESVLLHEARPLARRILEAFRPYCSRGAIAGSVRREKPEVKDIEVVIVPKWETVPDPDDLFGERSLDVNLLHKFAQSEDRLSAALGFPMRWIKPGTRHIEPWHVKPEGKYWRGYLPGREEEGARGGEGVKVDVFLTTPQNFGAILLIRTGSRDFSEAVAIHAKRVGYRFDDGELWRGQVNIPTPDEATVFEHLALEWVEPRDRHGLEQVRNRAASKEAAGAAAAGRRAGR